LNYVKSEELPGTHAIGLWRLCTPGTTWMGKLASPLHPRLTVRPDWYPSSAKNMASTDLPGQVAHLVLKMKQPYLNVTDNLGFAV